MSELKPCPCEPCAVCFGNGHTFNDLVGYSERCYPCAGTGRVSRAAQITPQAGEAEPVANEAAMQEIARFVGIPGETMAKLLGVMRIIRSAPPQAGAEPAAWMIVNGKGHCKGWTTKAPTKEQVVDYMLINEQFVPLYRTAPPSPVCDGNHAAPARADPECWQRPSPVAPEPTPEGMCRAALLWVLWHHQGGSSDVGQPIRFALGMGAHEPLSAEQVEAAKSYGALTKKWPPDSPGATEEA